MIVSVPFVSRRPRSPAVNPPPAASLELTAEQVAALESAFPEMPCVGPDGQPAGFWVEAGQFRALRRLAYIEMERQRDARPAVPIDPDRKAALEGMNYHGKPWEVLKRMMGRWEDAGLLPAGNPMANWSPDTLLRSAPDATDRPGADARRDEGCDDGCDEGGERFGKAA